MTRDEAETAVRALCRIDGTTDTRVTQAMIQVEVQSEFQQLRRLLAKELPRLYTATTSTQTLTTSDAVFDLPSDFERVIRFEVRDLNNVNVWYPVDVSDEYRVHVGGPISATRTWIPPLTFREEAGALHVAPIDALVVPLTFRLVYTKAPVVTSNYTIEVPAGLEAIITRRVAAGLVSPRLRDDGAAYAADADRIWSQQLPALKRRYGNHPRPGLRRTRGRW